jgi:hypothetical protein
VLHKVSTLLRTKQEIHVDKSRQIGYLYFSFAAHVSTLVHLKPTSFTLENARPFSRDIKGEGKAIPLQALTGPEVSRRLKLPDFKTVVGGGKVVSPPHRPPLPPGNSPGTHFC